MTRLINISLLLLALLSLTACGPTYYYNGKSFSDPNLAYKEQKTHLDNISNEIIPVEKSLYENALILLPDYAAINNKSVKKGRTSTPEIVEYVSKATQANLYFMANCLKKSNMFNNITIEESGKPQKTAIKKLSDFDVVIFYKLISQENQIWQLLTQNTPEAIDLPIDETKEAGLERTQQWLDDVQSTLLKY